MKALELISIIERTAIPAGAASWDKCGVQVAGRRTAVNSMAVALDPTLETVERALKLNIDFILTHHPLSMQPRYLDKVDDHFRTVAALIEHNVCLYSAHTTLDANPKGPVGWLADALHLQGRRLIEPTYRQPLDAFAFAVPDNFDAALLQTWRALDGAYTATVQQNMVQITCTATAAPNLRSVIANDLGSAPMFICCPAPATESPLGFGCIGTLPEPMTFDGFCDSLAQVVDREFWITSGPVPGTVETVAYCTGSGSSLADAAFAMGADIFITGDVKYHSALDAVGCILDVGHFSLEEEMMRQFALQLGKELPDVDIFFLPAQDPMRLAVRGAR